MTELRAYRDAFQDIELGLSYARRVVQGRLDTVEAELGRRAGDDGGDLLQILPDVLAAHVRGPGLPRPTRDIDPPPWADEILVELDEALTPNELAGIDTLETPRLIESAARIGEIEQEISAARSQMHGRIDRVQEELISRYRAGATVDDLLA
jgi:hypothetical protein